MTTLPSLDALKAQARALRTALQNTTPLSHSQSLELVAKQHGFKDWNTLHAKIGNRPAWPRYQIGQSVSGTYLGQAFRAEIRAVRARADGWYALNLKFDTPIDVVQFPAFSSFRSYVNCTIGPDGCTVEKTSDGRPHVVLNPA